MRSSSETSASKTFSSKSLITISSIGYQRLGTTEDTRDTRDLEQTRLAIETMRAVTPILGQFVPAELIRDFDQSVANLQLAYASAAADDAAEDTAEDTGTQT